ncbi:MAG: tyrosine-type recombinase/integrase, partial [Ilumatobacteraceae bacterium]
MSWCIDDFAASLTAASPHTVSAYCADVRDFGEWAERGGVDDAAAVDRLLLRRYVAHLTTRRFAKRTVARKVAALRKYFRWQLRSGLITADPSASLHAPSGDGRLPRVLTTSEITGLLDAPSPQDEPIWRRHRDDAVLEILYGSGVRVSELCGLDLGDVRAGGTVTVWGKGSKQRSVPLSGPAVDALRAWMQVRHDVVPPEAGA